MRWRRYALLRSWRIIPPDELDELDGFLDASTGRDQTFTTVRDQTFTGRGQPRETTDDWRVARYEQ